MDKSIIQQLREVYDPDQDENDASEETKLAVLRKVQDELERLTVYEIDVARSMKKSWQQIADAYGVTKQTAWNRWHKPSDPPVDTDPQALLPL
jgi:hypothetical protein